MTHLFLDDQRAKITSMVGHIWPLATTWIALVKTKKRSLQDACNMLPLLFPSTVHQLSCAAIDIELLIVHSWYEQNTDRTQTPDHPPLPDWNPPSLVTSQASWHQLALARLRFYWPCCPDNQCFSWMHHLWTPKQDYICVKEPNVK